MASKIVYLEVLDDAALDNMLAFVGSLIRNKYNTHKLETQIGFAIQARGVQKIEFVARRTDFKEIADGTPDLPQIAPITPTVADGSKEDIAGNINTSNESQGNGSGIESSLSSDADNGDAQPDTDSGC
jgi:hypothetical protein